MRGQKDRREDGHAEQVRQHDNTEAHPGGQVDEENGQSFVKVHASFLFLFQRIMP